MILNSKRLGRVSVSSSDLGAGLAFLLTSIVWLGWIFNWPLLRSFFPGLPGMVPLTATCISLLAVSLYGVQRGYRGAVPPSLFWFRTTLIAAGFAILICVLTLLETSFGFRTGIHLILFPETLVSGIFSTTPGRVSPQTCVAVILLSGAVLSRLFTGDRIRQGPSLLQTGGLLALAMAMLAILGYVYHATKLFGLSRLIGLSLPTTLSFIALSIGTLSLEPHRGLVGLWTSPSSSGFFLRRFTFFGVLVPLVMAALLRWGEVASLFDHAFGTSLFVIFTVVSLMTMALQTAKSLQDIEDQRFELELGRLKLNQEKTRNDEVQRVTDRLNLALAASRMATWEWDYLHKKLTTTWNYFELYGYFHEAPEWTSERYFSSIHEEDREFVRSSMLAAIRGETSSYATQFRVVWPDGSIHWLAGNGQALRDSQGRTTTLRGTVLDIQSLKENEIALQKAKAEAEAASAMKSTFLSNMSHEIRTPMTAILGFSDVLREEKLSEAERDDFLGRIQKSGRSLLKLIDDILDISKIEASRLMIEKVAFSPEAVLEEVVAMLQMQAESKGLRLSVEKGDSVPQQILSDPNRLRQILVNLIGNAVKFTESGSVVVRLRGEIAGSESKVIFEVNDTGIGIPEKDQSQIFQPFMQADSSITRRFGGTGLGLVLSQRLAERMGGKLELVRSAPGEGSNFTVTIMATAVSSNQSQQGKEIGPAAAPEIDSKKTLSSIRVLLAEDTPDNQFLIRHYLEGAGALVDLAEDGGQAVQKALATKHDLILMDIQMPVMDGLEATRLLRKSGLTIPILALTAHAMKEQREMSLVAGCNDHLTKPIGREQLIKSILRYARP